MSTKRKINNKDIDLLKTNLWIMFKIRENIEYDVTEDDFGFQVNFIKSFAGIENANSTLLLMSHLFCNFGFSSCGNGHTNTTHEEEIITLQKHFNYLENLKTNNQYEVSETTITTANKLLTNLTTSLNNEENRKSFNDHGNVEVYSDANKFIWIDVFVKSNKVSIVCKETSVSAIYPLAFNLDTNVNSTVLNKFVSVVCSAQ